jgi:hypothetical protein
MLIVLCMRCANYAQGLRVGKFSVSVLWVALGHIGKFQWWSSESVSYSACCCGASEVRPASFSVLDPCKPSASAVPILPSAAKQSKFHHRPPPTCGDLRQTSPNGTSSTPRGSCSRAPPRSHCLSLADRCMLFFSCRPLMNSLFYRGGWDWVALGVMCVL